MAIIRGRQLVETPQCNLSGSHRLTQVLNHPHLKEGVNSQQSNQPPTAKKPTPPPAKDEKPSTGTSQSKLSPEEQMELIFLGFLMRNNVKPEEAMTERDKAKWDFFFNAYGE